MTAQAAGGWLLEVMVAELCRLVGPGAIAGADPSQFPFASMPGVLRHAPGHRLMRLPRGQLIETSGRLATTTTVILSDERAGTPPRMDAAAILARTGRPMPRGFRTLHPALPDFWISTRPHWRNVSHTLAAIIVDLISGRQDPLDLLGGCLPAGRTAISHMGDGSAWVALAPLCFLIAGDRAKLLAVASSNDVRIGPDPVDLRLPIIGATPRLRLCLSHGSAASARRGVTVDGKAERIATVDPLHEQICVSPTSGETTCVDLKLSARDARLDRIDIYLPPLFPAHQPGDADPLDRYMDDGAWR